MEADNRQEVQHGRQGAGPKVMLGGEGGMEQKPENVSGTLAGWRGRSEVG